MCADGFNECGDRCEICGKYLDIAPFSEDDYFVIHNSYHEDKIYVLCSPSCLVEYSWRLKEEQNKLSKSKKVENNDRDSDFDQEC